MDGSPFVTRFFLIIVVPKGGGNGSNEGRMKREGN